MTTWNTTQMKLNPTGVVGATAIHFPGFQKISDFTSAGSESSLAVTVNSDTDLEYGIMVWNPHAIDTIYMRLNNDSGNNYGHQYLLSTGTIAAGRVVVSYLFYVNNLTFSFGRLLAPVGFTKTATYREGRYTSGTTIGTYVARGVAWNSTANVTSINFVLSLGGNFTAGTRIIIYKRVS